jgi:hypothetical protein
MPGESLWKLELGGWRGGARKEGYQLDGWKNGRKNLHQQKVHNIPVPLEIKKLSR